MNRIVASAFILAAIALQATASHAAILLDNTDNLTKGFTFPSITWRLNDTAYNTENAFSFDIGGTSYDATSISLGLRDTTNSNPINVRLQFYELAAPFTTPAGVTPFFTQDFAGTVLSSLQYYTFQIASGAVNFKANTRYAIGILTDSGSSTTNWYSSGGATPTSPDATFITTSQTTNGSTYSIDSTSSYSLQLTGDAVTAVPEPSTWALALAGVTCSVWVMARRRRRAAGDAYEALGSCAQPPCVSPGRHD